MYITITLYKRCMRLITTPASQKLHVHDELTGQLTEVAVAQYACIGIIVIAI